jgi:hypothetical protein
VPILRFPGTSEAKLQYGVTQIFCCMAYPCDPDRAGLLLYELMKQGVDSLEPRDRGNVNELELLLLRRLQMTGRLRIRDEAVGQFAKASVAGGVLLNALRAGMHHPEHRSLKKAIFLVSELAKKWPRPPKRLPMSESKVMTYWTEFRSVAHLHAADMFTSHEDPTWRSANPSAVSRFLTIAEQISKTAHEQSPPVGRTSKSVARDKRLLDRVLTLRVVGGPRRLKGRIEFGDLSEEEVSVLARYRESRLFSARSVARRPR